MSHPITDSHFPLPYRRAGARYRSQVIVSETRYTENILDEHGNVVATRYALLDHNLEAMGPLGPFRDVI